MADGSNGNGGQKGMIALILAIVAAGIAFAMPCLTFSDSNIGSLLGSIAKYVDSDSFTLMEFSDFQGTIGEAFGSDDAMMTSLIFKVVAGMVGVGAILSILGCLTKKSILVVISPLTTGLAALVCYSIPMENEAYAMTMWPIVALVVSIVAFVIALGVKKG